MEVSHILVVATAVVIVGGLAIILYRRKDRVSGGVDVPGIGRIFGQATNNPRDASIRDATATADVSAVAPQGSATVERASGRNITATAGELSPKE